MAWSTPTHQATGYTVTSADWNGIQDNLSYLYGDTGWTTIGAFTNTWTANATFPPAYMLLGRVVYLRGALNAGTAATAAFTLPAGYRPTLQSEFVTVVTGTTINTIAVNTSGTVVPVNSSTVWLSGVVFPVV